jgi:hypothetical protein
MGALAEHVKGWPRIGENPADSSGPDARSPNTRAEAVVNKMVAAGMLTKDPAVGKEAEPLRMPSANAALVEPDLDWRPAVAFSDVFRFFMASLITAVALRLLPIRSVVMGTARRKAAAASSAKPFDVNVARRATEVFLYLRPLLFSAQDACLFDSLALTRFLSYYRQFPSCVIGVQTGPFGAHCWVQEGDVVFNDAPEYVRRFTPILAV